MAQRCCGLCFAAGSGADIDRMQALGALNDFELNRLSGLEGLVSVHFDGGIVCEQVLIATFGEDEAIAFGVVEPLDLTTEHAVIPLQRTPWLGYHPP